MSRACSNPAIVIIGSGFSGLCMAIRLKHAGHHNFVILEKNDDLGGTWRDNQYPGCACDVPSHMYSFSFELNPDWSRMFAPQEEIWAYLRRCADKYGVAAHIHYGRDVERIEWDDDVRRWHVATTSGDVYTTRAVVSGSGGLHVPSIPEIPGADRFAGPGIPLGAVGPLLRSFRQAGRGHRNGRVGDSVRSADRPAGRTGLRVPADAAVASIPGRTSRSRPRSAPCSAPRRR